MIHNLKPYPAYKDSGVPWLGKIPEDWNVMPLKKVSRRMQNGSTPPTENPEYYIYDGLPWYGPSSLGQSITIGKPVKCVSSLAVHDGKVRLINPPALAVSVIGNVGRSALILDLGATNQQITCFELCINLVIPEFTAYQFKLAETALMHSSSSSTISILDTNLLRNTRIAFPQAISEQSAIVRYLDHFDRRIQHYIRAKKKIIKLLEEQKQAIIHQAVTRGLDPNVKLKPSGVEWLGDIPEHWEVKRLKYLFHEVDERSSTGTEVLLSLRMYRGLVPHNDVSEIRIDSSALVGFKCVSSGQVVMNRMRASIGMFGVALQPGLVSPDYAVFESAAEVDQNFFLHLFKTHIMGTVFRQESKGLGTGSAGFMRLYTDRFGIIKVPLPPLEEQNAIMNAISKKTETIRKTIENLEYEIFLLREYRTRLIADVVTGKLDVREAAANLPEETDETEVLEDEFAGDEETAEEELESEPEEE